MKIYRGVRGMMRVIVAVDGAPLNPRFDLRNHSPDGFEWGYGGSGPSQLALAIVADHTGSDDRATHLYYSFKDKVIAGIQSDYWELTSDQVQAAIDEINNGN